MTYPFEWITKPLMHQQAVARRNAARATALCSERRREREEVDAYLTALRQGHRHRDAGLSRNPAPDRGHT